MAGRRVRVEFEVEIPEDADLYTAEGLLLRASREAVSKALSETGEQSAEAGPCPECEKKGQSGTGSGSGR